MKQFLFLALLMWLISAVLCAMILSCDFAYNFEVNFGKEIRLLFVFLLNLSVAVSFCKAFVYIEKIK